MNFEELRDEDVEDGPVDHFLGEGFVTEVVRDLERQFHDGQRHVYEAQMKEDRRTTGKAGHEHRPAAAHDPRVETD